MRFLPHGLALAGLLLLSTTATARVPDDMRGWSRDGQTPSLYIPPAEIAIDVPMPVNGANLGLLLAQVGKGTSLSSIKEATRRKYQQHLQGELSAQLREFFTDEEVPLVDKEGLLTLRSQLQVKVIKHLSKLESRGGYELERGTVELSGSFHYQLQDLAGAPLREESLDLSNLKVSEHYSAKSTSGGEAEDNTEQAIKLALSKLVKKILREIDGDLEADELRDIAAG